MLPLLASLVLTSSVATSSTSTAAPALEPVADLTYVASLVVEARERGLASEREWHVLLHYRAQSFGGFESTADTASFFLSRTGQTDPEAELTATLEAFAAPVPSDPEEMQAQCKFPGRYLWLKQALGFDAARLPEHPCPRFEAWRKQLGARSATLIFASAYLNNPASMFGHPFLRLNRRAAPAASDLSAYTVNYAADPTTSNPFGYAILGLLGGFEGRFSTLPYYLKVKEYGALEDRDLWEYDLRLDDTQLDRLVRHLWEMGAAGFAYWYLDENCSFQILALLEAAEPSLRLLDEFPAWVLPADTLRVLQSNPGLVAPPRFRPSRGTTIRAQYARLAAPEQALASRLSTGNDEAFDAVKALPPERQAATLDVAWELLRHRVGKDDLPPDEGELESRLLLARGRLRVPSVPAPIEAPDPPEEGHGTSAVLLGGGAADTGAFVDLTLRLSLHDLLDDQTGYVPGSQIELLTTQLRLRTADPVPVLERADFVRITSLAPIESWIFRASWRLRVGAERARESGCVEWRCIYAGAAGGPGLSIELGRWRAVQLVPYVFLDADLRLAGPYPDHGLIGLGASGGLMLDVFTRWRVQLEASYLYPLLGRNRPDLEPGPADGPDFRLMASTSVRLLREVQLRGMGAIGRGYREASGAVVIYW